MQLGYKNHRPIHDEGHKTVYCFLSVFLLAISFSVLPITVSKYPFLESPHSSFRLGSSYPRTSKLIEKCFPFLEITGNSNMI